LSDETRIMQAVYGPYRDQRLSMSAADAEQAIADKWAIDPFAPAPVLEEGEEVEPQTGLPPEEAALAIEAATHWRDEQVRKAEEFYGTPPRPSPEEREELEEPKERSATAERQLEPGGAGQYQTRAPSRPPPPPPPPRGRPAGR
jgi:hypothetical protein